MRSSVDGPSRATRVVANLPDRSLLVFLAVATVFGVTVTLGIFTPLVVVPLTVLAIAFSWRLMPAAIARTGWAARASAASVVVALVWIVGNLHFVSQQLQVTRDPGIYTVTGIWLIHHPSPTIGVQSAVRLVHGIPALSADLGKFHHLASGVVQLQGGDLLPAFMGAVGWVGGIPAALGANVIIGGIALVGLYALARRVVGPVWALLPEIVLGFSMPMIYLSRAPYSEIIMLLVCIAGLVWLISALRTGLLRDYMVGGAFLGLSGFTRIDGPLAIIGVAAAMFVVSLGFVPREGRRSFARGVLAFSVVGIVFLLAGLVDLALQKPAYLAGLGGQVGMLWAAMVLTVVLAVVASRLGSRLPELSSARVRVIAIVAASSTAAAFLFWASRPLWMVSRMQSGTGDQAVRALQRAEGLPVDGSRSYEEYTLSWVGWYFGWPLLIVACVGIALLVYVSIRQSKWGTLFLVASTLATAALYFERIDITPDQPWAFRRLLPLITPGLLIAATWVLAVVWKSKRRWLKAGALAVAASFLVAPVLALGGLAIARDGGGQYAEEAAICARITTKTVVVPINGGPENYALTLRTACNVNVVETTSAVTPANLAALVKRTGPVDAVLFAPKSLPTSGTLGPPTHVTHAQFWSVGLLRTPTVTIEQDRQVWVGHINAAGKFTTE